MCSLCNRWPDIGCNLSDVEQEFILQNDLFYVCLSCLIKKGNDFNSSIFSVHNEVEISGDTRDNLKNALDLWVSSGYYNLSDTRMVFLLFM